MSNSFVQLWLASLAGVTTYHLLREIYWEIKARFAGSKYSKWFDDLEEDTWEEED